MERFDVAAVVLGITPGCLILSLSIAFGSRCRSTVRNRAILISSWAASSAAIGAGLAIAGQSAQVSVPAAILTFGASFIFFPATSWAKTLKDAG